MSRNITNPWKADHSPLGYFDEKGHPLTRDAMYPGYDQCCPSCSTKLQFLIQWAIPVLSCPHCQKNIFLWEDHHWHLLPGSLTIQKVSL